MQKNEMDRLKVLKMTNTFSKEGMYLYFNIYILRNNIYILRKEHYYLDHFKSFIHFSFQPSEAVKSFKPPGSQAISIALFQNRAIYRYIHVITFFKP